MGSDESEDGRLMDGKCMATNKDGAPCRAGAWRDQLCRWHHPTLEEARAEGRRKGGYGKSNAARAKKQLALSSDDLLATLSRAMIRVEDGVLAPGPANALGSLARAMNEIRKTAEFERRIAELEQRAGIANDRRIS
jgi:hypothetical protein